MKLVAANKESPEEHPMINLLRDTNAPRNNKKYITQVSEEIEGRVATKISQESSRTESRLLGSLSS